jgi:hypothetical protein
VNHNDDDTQIWFRRRWVSERIVREFPVTVQEITAGRRPHRVRRDFEKHDRAWSRSWTPHLPCSSRLAEMASWSRRSVRTERRLWLKEHAVLPVAEVIAATRQHWNECGKCGKPMPCPKVRRTAARYAGDPQYAALWG